MISNAATDRNRCQPLSFSLTTCPSKDTGQKAYFVETCQDLLLSSQPVRQVIGLLQYKYILGLAEMCELERGLA